MRARLTLLESSAGVSSPRVTIGECPSLPEEGLSFLLLSDDDRAIQTSPVVAVHGQIFETQNSLYLLEVYQ